MIPEPPQDLKTGLRCRIWRCLPGDLQDQECGIMDRITLALTVYDIFKAHKNADDWVKWQKDYPEEHDLFDAVTRMRNDRDRNDSDTA